MAKLGNLKHLRHGQGNYTVTTKALIVDRSSAIYWPLQGVGELVGIGIQAIRVMNKYTGYSF